MLPEFYIENTYGRRKWWPALGFHVFDTDRCENCGELCEAPNAVTYVETEERLKSLGMKRAERRLPALVYSETLNMAVCESCDREAEG